MAYEPLNLQNGQVLTAEDVQHIEQGVQDVLPQNPGAYQYPATDGDGNMAWADMLAYSIPAFNFEYSGSTAGLPSFTVQGDEFTGLKKYYQIAAGDFPLTGFQNMVVRDEGNDNQAVETFYQSFSSGYHALWFELANGPDGYTRLYWFDGKISVLADETNPDAGTITPEAGIYGMDGGDGTAKLNDAFMCYYNGQTKTIDPKFLPAGDAVGIPVQFVKPNSSMATATLVEYAKKLTPFLLVRQTTTGASTYGANIADNVSVITGYGIGQYDDCGDVNYAIYAYGYKSYAGGTATLEASVYNRSVAKEQADAIMAAWVDAGYVVVDECQ